MTLPFFCSLSLESLHCHPEDQKPDPDVVPPEPTLKTLMYDSFLSVTIYLCCASDKPTAFKLVQCSLICRQRKEEKDNRSLKGGKNRHDLYADELVGPSFNA